MSRPLFDVWPKLREALPIAKLGDFPTPVESLANLSDRVGHDALFIKRDDLSAAAYGGNKVRTLEFLLGEALHEGLTSVVSTGAYGSNHAVATVLHAPRVGLQPEAMLFPQPASWAALENLRVTASRARLTALPHVGLYPYGMWRLRRRARREKAFVMVPGGATPLGALGYVSAALELALQAQRGQLPPVSQLVIGVGSTCTSAGLLVGLRLAAQLGIGFSGSPPKLVSVRVTPWPITAKFRIVSLAQRTSALLAELSGDARVLFSSRELSEGLVVDGRFLGGGYGRPTADGEQMCELFKARQLPQLDTTYSAKAASGFVDWAKRSRAPTLFWSTKSTAALPTVDVERLRAAPKRIRRYIADAERLLGARGELPDCYGRLV